MTKRLTGLVVLPLLLIAFISLSGFTKAIAAPPIPNISGSLTVCIGNSTTITASSTPADPNVIFRWYTKVGIIYLHTIDGPTFNTGALLLNTDYYVESYNTVTFQTSAPHNFTVSVVPLNVDVVAATPADLTLCAGDSTTFTATSLLGNTVFEWYDALVGGNKLYTGNPYQSGPLYTVPSLYVSSLNAGGCASPRLIAVTPVVVPAVDVPLASPLVSTVCSGQQSTFTVSSLGAVSYNWYNTLLGGSPLHTGNTFTPNAETNTGSSNLLTLYYVEAVDVNGCRSLRTPVTVLTLPAVDVPLVTPLATTICNGDSITFTGSALLGSTTFRWYDSLIGGNLLYSGNPFNTGSITNSGAVPLTYTVYLEARDNNGCASLRTPGIAVITPALDVPLVNPPVQTVCSGDSVTFTGSGLLGGATYNWYDSLFGGNLLHTGTTYTTSALSNAGTTNLINTVYLEIQDTLGCKSLRTPGLAVVTPALAVPLANPLISTICNGGSAEFTATSLLGTGTFSWYDALTGGVLLHTGDTFNTGTITSSGPTDLLRLFYVQVQDSNGCSSLRTPVTVAVVPALDLPLVTPPIKTICSGASASFVASSLLGSAQQFYWYNDISGGSPIDSGSTFNTGSLLNPAVTSLNETYYVELVDTNGCSSLRTPALVIITPSINAPLLSPLIAPICSGNSATFTASSILTTDQVVNWYDSLNGVVPIFTGESFNTGNLTQTGVTDLTRIYYAEIEDSLGCKSLRTPATVVFTPALATPIVSDPIQTICSGDSADFFISFASLLDTNITYYWYDSLIGGNLLAVGDTFNTGSVVSSGPLDLTRIYYVEAVDTGGCKSIRTPAILALIPALDVPVVLPPTNLVCSGTSTEFIATSLLSSAAQFNWYDGLTGGNLLYVGDTFNTGILTQNGPTDLNRIYYVELQDSNGCKSLRTPATAIFAPALTLPLVTNPVVTICNGDSAEFTAMSLLDSTLTYSWYDALTGGNLLYVGNPFNTGQILSSGTLDLTRIYYVEALDSAGCRSLRTPATVVITPALDVPLVNPLVQTVCNGSTAQFTVISTLGSAKTFYWYDALSGGNLLAVGDTFTTDTITQSNATDLTRIYYVELEDTNGCRSLRVPATVAIIPALEVPLVVPPTSIVCSGQKATFIATNLLQTKGKFNWYTSLTGGAPIYVGDTYTTGDLINSNLTSLTYTYYVEFEDTNGCKSLRTPAIAIVAPSPVPPVVLPPADVICNNQSAQFVAQALLGSDHFNWYDSLLAANPIFTGDTFNTPLLVNTSGLDLLKTYFVESVDSNGCRSIRSLVTVVIRPALNLPLVTPPVATVCNGTTATFTASALLGGTVTYNWYDTILGGSPIYTGASYTTDTLNNPQLVNLVKTYYVELTDSTGCTSLRTPAVALVLPGLNVPVTLPVAPVCNGTSATLIATSLLDSLATFYWYDSLTGTTPIFIGDTFVTGPLVSSGLTDLLRTYYVESRGVDNCTSARVPVIVTLLPALDVPLVNPPVGTVCSGNSISFTASSLTNPNLQYEWYDTIQGGTLLATGSMFTTPVLSNQGLANLIVDYYVQSKDSNGCTSARIPVLVIITPALNVPLVSPAAQTICNNDSAVFVASSLLPSAGFRWYNSIAGGALLFEGDTFNTGPIQSGSVIDVTRLYYVETYDSMGCTSIRVPAAVVITNNPDVLVLIPVLSTICQGDSTIITAVSAMANLSVNWYTSPTADTAVYTGQVYNTGILFDTITYYVSTDQNITGCESARYPVTINVNPVLPLDGPDVRCARLTRDVIRFEWAAVPNANRYEVSIDNGKTWQDPSSGQSGLYHDVTRTQNNEPGVDLIARAINRDNTCAPENGVNSISSHCSYTDEITSSFNPYNSFSPNKDGVNDVWTIGDGIEYYPSNEVSVFNRWGKEVYKQKGYNNTTKVFDAEGLDDGAYYYVIRIPEIDYVKTGYVMVIR